MKESRTYNPCNNESLSEVQQWINNLWTLRQGKRLTIIVTTEITRTLPQNNWFHAIVQLITDFNRKNAKERGDENYYKINFDRTKLWIKDEFLGYEEVNGERQLRKTSRLKTFEMTELWDNLQRYFSPLGLDIPSPNEKDYRKGK